MDTTFGVNFAESFESLSKLLCESESAAQRDVGQVSRAKPSDTGPAGVGPKGIFPNVKVAEPVGADAETSSVKFEKPAPKGAVKLVNADNVEELVNLLHNEAKVI